MGWRWITLVLLLVGVAPARGQTPPAPDPAPTGYTDRDYDADALALERAFSVEVYRNADRRAAAWDEAVIALLDDYAKLWAETSDRPNWTKFGQRGTRLLEDGCDDPLVQMAVGQALHRTNSINRTRRLMLSAIDRLEEHGYPAVWRARAGRLVAHYMRVWEKPAEAAEQHRKAVYALFESLRRNEFGDGGKRFFHADLDVVIEDLVPSDATALIERVRADDTIDPWIAACAQSLCFLHIGWEARGTGWARGVTEEQWAVFEVNLTEAVTHLSRAWEIDP
ncbi:MAG: hypothetical protein GY715_13025, partial [Planctomycetes bacterium]|nr:hypothetical protein [Planctomycetota bacterium]